MTALIDRIGQWLSPEWDFNYACCREGVLFLNVLYGAFLVINSALFVLYIYVFTCNKRLHANFRVILLIFATNDIVLIYHRLADFWLTGIIDRENGFTYFIKMNCWAMLLLSLCNVIGERLYSLYAYKWYNMRIGRYHEAYRHFPIRMILIYIVQEICVGFLILMRIISKRMIVDCLAAMVLLTGIFLIANYRISRRRHRQVIAMRFQFSDGDSLSHRLRTMEILRENRLLLSFLPYLLISSLLQLLEASIILHFIVPIDHRYYLIGHCIFYLTIAIRVLFDLLIPILAHPVIKADAKKTLRSLIKIFRRKKHSKVTPMGSHTSSVISPIHSTDGQRLSFSPEQEKEMYFASYKQLWGAP